LLLHVLVFVLAVVESKAFECVCGNSHVSVCGCYHCSGLESEYAGEFTQRLKSSWAGTDRGALHCQTLFTVFMSVILYRCHHDQLFTPQSSCNDILVWMKESVLIVWRKM